MLRAAIELMDRSISLMQSAINDLAADPIASDDTMTKLAPVLVEMFCCRQVGEGFATVVNALLCAVQNHASSKWLDNQLQVAMKEPKHLREEPFLKCDQALDVIDNLEGVDLTPQPQAFEYLADWLDAESIR